jgi:hypothetical protein
MHVTSVCKSKEIKKIASFNIKLETSVSAFMNEYEISCPTLRAKCHIKKNSVALVRERTIPTERPPLVGVVSVNFTDRRCRVVKATDPHGRILDFKTEKCHIRYFEAGQAM